VRESQRSLVSLLLVDCGRKHAIGIHPETFETFNPPAQTGGLCSLIRGRSGRVRRIRSGPRTGCT
jgi:hypothetical protein